MSESTIAVRYNEANIRGLGPDFVLKPGVNHVPERIVQQFIAVPVFKLLVEEGKIVFLDSTPSAAAPKRRGRPRKSEQTDANEQAEPSASELSRLLDEAAEQSDDEG